MNIKKFICICNCLLSIVVITVFAGCGKTADTKELYLDAIRKTVEIRCYNSNDKTGYATGCIISGDGKILTNKHVIMTDGEPFATIEVRPYDSEEYIEAEILEISDKEDLALIKIVKETKYFFSLGDSVGGGESVYTIGNPNGFGLSFSEGKVASPLRFVDYNNVQIKTIQTSIIINEGNSGGALFNEKCELIGLISFRLRNSAGEVIQGVSFAIHYSVLAEFI